ncbi:MAG: ABC transporter permease [Verrucomicrobiales bacterium]|nr:ABC transporter permease [Verrucomicrobiales bacterium]
MNSMRKLQFWVRAIFRKRRLDLAMDEEMRSHIEMQTRENIEAGMIPEEARFAALREFGQMESIKETCREQRGVSWLENLLQDARYGTRKLRKNRGFTAVAVITLALGIGATTVVFSIVNGVLLQPLEYPGSERIVNVWESDPKKGFQSNYTSPANFVDWRRENQVFEAIAFAAHHDGWTTLSFIHTGEGFAERLPGRFVSTNYFKVFGLEPILGRSFLPEEEQRGAPRVVVISHRLWQRLFNGHPDVVGQSINLENQGRHRYEIIGIMPEGFRFPGAEVWVSCAHMPRPMTLRGGGGMHVVARLKPGVSLEKAQAEMTAIQSRIHAEYGHLEQRGQHLVIGSQIRLQRLLDSAVGDVRSSLVMFSGAVALVLLIACANVANLLLSRALARQREMAVRAALGASRWRIVCQLLCESVVLSLLGGIAGTLLAYWGSKLVVQFSAGSIPRIETVGIDFRVFLFAMAVSLGTGILFGLAPALQSSRTELNEFLKDGAQRASGGLGQFRLRNAFTITQVGLTFVLLIGAGLLIRSFQRLQDVETGFDTDLLTADITMTGASYNQHDQRRVFLRALIEKMETVPGVESVCAVSMIPDRGGGWPTPYARMDRPTVPTAQRPLVTVQVCTPNYLKTYGILLLRGRDFTEADSPQSERVLLVNQAFADKVFPGEDPIGKQIDCGGPSQIIGVMANIKNSGLAGETRPLIYGTYQQWGFQSAFLTVRAKSNPMALVPIVTDNVRALNPAQPLTSFRTMQSFLDQSTARPRFRTLLLASFAFVALVLASVGIYGVMAYSVAQRTTEMGIRMALGAQKSDVMRLVLKQGLGLTLIGICIGLAGSVAFAQILKTQLFGIGALDPVTFLGVSLLLTSVALTACLIPALRAMRVNPMEALRHD